MRGYAGIGIGALFAAGLYLTSRFSYLLFHSLVEMLCVAVAAGIFIVAWNTRRVHDNGYFLVLGVAYACVGALDLLHALSYSGMGVFASDDPNPATQLWIASRSVESVALLVALRFVDKRTSARALAAGYAVVFVALVGAVFAGVFPDCYLSGSGLTAFKVVAEYCICLVLLGAGIGLYRGRASFDRRILLTTLGAIALTIMAELAFTCYVSVFGPSNLLGHLFKLLSFFLIYRALIETGLTRPFSLLFRDLKRHEEALEQENQRLDVLQKRLSKQNEELATLNKEKNELLGVAAHDIRSPLSVIQMQASLLLGAADTLDADKRAQFLGVIKKRSQFTIALVDKVLDIAAVEAGKLEMTPESTEMVHLVEECLGPAEMLAAQKDLTFHFEHDPAPIDCHVDPVRMEQVLGNYVSNAIKFSKPGRSITVALRKHADEAVLSVADEGHGIGETDREGIFEPFVRRAERGTNGEKGTGLGLAIAKRVVEAHGGRVWLQSAIGKGSTFFAAFPREATRPDTRSEPPEAPPSRTSAD